MPRPPTSPTDDGPDPRPEAGPRLRALLGSPLGRVLRLALVGALAVLALSLVMRQARAAVHRLPAYRLGPESVRFLDLSPTVDERMRAHLVNALPRLFPAAPAARPCVYDPGVEVRVREILGGHPMVRALRDVEVRHPAEIRARVDVRTPLARFEARVGTANGRPLFAQVPLDRDAVVLDPEAYSLFLAQFRTVLVTGVGALCPAVGRRWTDSREQVAEGLEAARVANRLNDALAEIGPLRVETVDVAAFPAPPRERARGEVVLRLSDGRSVQWGRTERAADEVTREDGDDAKRDRLLDALAVRGAGAPRWIDVRFPPGSRRPVDR